MTTDEIIAYYRNLLIVQYETLSRARGTVETFVREVVASQITAQVRDGFSIDEGEGAQLDVLGKYVDANRVVFGVDVTHTYFELASYDDTDGEAIARPGFAEYDDADEDITDFFFTYPDADRPVYALNDVEMRVLIRYMAQLNSRFLSVKEVDDMLFLIFGTGVVLTDNLDMTVLYTHTPGVLDNVWQSIVTTEHLPRPAGILANVA